jgi:uncharacterized protein (TIGR02421 family)
MTTSTAQDEAFLDGIRRGFRADEHVRVRLPGGGVLNMDRKLPYLFVYRQPQTRRDEDTSRLVLGEASYLVSLGADDADVREVVRAVAEAGTAEFGSFLIIELWTGEPGSTGFVVRGPAGPAADTVDVLRRGLDNVQTGMAAGATSVHVTDERHPPDLAPLLTARESWRIGCLSLGLELPPLHHDEAGAAYPVFVRRLRGLLSPVLRQTAFEFARVQTTAGFDSYRALGPRRFGRALFDLDRELAEIERSYQFLLLMSPVDPTEAWHRFRADRYRHEPEFQYRLLPVDPDLLKRRLYALDLEEVADPAMAFLLRDKRDELDRQITMLAERNTPTFRYASIRLYGPVPAALLRTAHELLAQVPPMSRSARSTQSAESAQSAQSPQSTRSARSARSAQSARSARAERAVVTAEDFARLAHAELEHYRAAYPELAASVQIRPDLVGLMVSQGNLLIGHQLLLRPSRVDALLHHEVGTHVLTYYNGRAQPLRQLYTGLGGYDELQEGIAVFTEYLAGGLDAARMRTLAGRVVAAHSAEQGAGFLDTFRALWREHGFTPRTAFDIAERVHQCGGFTRDQIYLRGLLQLLDYLRAGGAFEPLFVGKIAARHIDILDELRERGFLVPPPLVPRVLQQPDAASRIEAARHGLPLTEMIRVET